MTTDREQLVERIARAMCAALDIDPDKPIIAASDAAPALLAWKMHRNDARAALSALSALDAGIALVPRKTLTEAHAVMRECGWHLAPVSEGASDGVLEAACAEIEDRFAQLLAASPIAKDA